jgi:hypothetical protein
MQHPLYPLPHQALVLQLRLILMQWQQMLALQLGLAWMQERAPEEQPAPQFSFWQRHLQEICRPSIIAVSRMTDTRAHVN